MKNTDITKTMGKPIPAKTPACRLFADLWDTFPIIAGPAAPPKSPARARSANIAVPPDGSICDEILIDPGHIIPTENPHNAHPNNPTNGILASPATR